MLAVQVYTVIPHTFLLGRILKENPSIPMGLQNWMVKNWLKNIMTWECQLLD